MMSIALNYVLVSTQFMLSTSTPGNSQTSDSTFDITTAYLQTLEQTKPDIYINGTSEIIPALKVKINPYVFLEYRVYKFIRKYFVYLTSFPGLITNPLTIYVARNISPQSTSEIHMFVIGITDLVLVSLRFTYHLLEQFEYQWTNISCKILYFFSNCSYSFSNWVLVTWTVERFLAVLVPMKMNVWCTLSSVKTVLITLSATCCLIAIPVLTEAHTIKLVNRNSVYCKYSEFYFQTYLMIDSIFYIYLPVTAIAVCNATIIVKIHFESKKRKVYTQKHDVLYRHSRKQMQMTMVLLTVSNTFFLLHLTQVLARVWEALYPKPRIILQYSAHNYAKFLMFGSLGYFITDFQNSINFFLYCIFGSKVRKVLRKTFCCKKVRCVSISQNIINNNIEKPQEN